MLDFESESDQETENDFETIIQDLNINLDSFEDASGSDGKICPQCIIYFSHSIRLLIIFIDFEQVQVPNSSNMPTEAMAILFVLMMHMLIGRFITDQCAEILMAFLNVALSLGGNQYRFPVKLTTFKNNSRFEENACSGLRTYVSCISCHSVYDIPASDVERRRNMNCTFPKRLSFLGNNVLEYCNQSLYDINHRNLSCTPKAYFMYNSILETMKKFFLRDDFVKDLKAWKNRKLNQPGFMFDCYDGEVFKTFKLNSTSDVPFVEESDFNLMFSFNVDWFQQFKNTQYSCGAMYLTCLNLPRSIRNLRENMIFVGLMPGGNGEASLQQMNHYLKPLVDELLIFQDGIKFVAPSVGEITVKGVCTLFVNDLPAASKALGFSSFNSTCSCRRCDHQFPRLPDSNQPDFSNLNVDRIPQRTKETNLLYAQQFKSLTNNAARQRHVQNHGTRWSEFHRLPYIDAVKFTVFDPMHNVWIGTCKRVVTHVFLKRGLLTKEHLDQMSNLCRNIILPIGYDSSSLARKINLGTGFSFMKADEWRVFTIALSPLLLKGRLDTQYYENWMIFVKCMQKMSLPGISFEDVDICHEMIKEFAAGFLALYGKEEMMSNLHYHFHLKVISYQIHVQFLI